MTDILLCIIAAELGLIVIGVTIFVFIEAIGAHKNKSSPIYFQLPPGLGSKPEKNNESENGAVSATTGAYL